MSSLPFSYELPECISLWMNQGTFLSGAEKWGSHFRGSLAGYRRLDLLNRRSLKTVNQSLDDWTMRTPYQVNPGERPGTKAS
jgi:hypothetical protein